MKNVERKNLSFHMSNPEEKKVFDFFEKCGKKATTLTALALKEFIEKYDLGDKDKEFIWLFVSHYELFKDKMAIQPIVYGYQPVGVSSVLDTPEPEQKEEIEPDLSKEKAAKLMNIQSMFMSA